ncbi:MAG: hypothetical protein PHE56_04375 [Bacteroidales bacterium]|nr:hypothetical protein [Bacteroidales bacterium]
MKNSFNDIDNFLHDSFEDFSSEPAPALRSSISAKVRKFNFFRFNPMSFNIFYLIALIVGTGTIVSFATTGNDTYVAKNTVSPDKNIFELENLANQTNDDQISSHNLTPEFESITNNEINNNAHKSNISKKNTEIENVVENPIASNENHTVIVEEKTSNSLNDKIIVTEISTPIEKNIIFDTIIEEEKSTIIDTVNIEVRKTVEIKRKRKSLK